MVSEPTWSKVGQLELRERLSISDTSYFYDAPLVTNAAPGIWEIRIQRGRIGVCSVKVFKGDVSKLTRGAQLGSVLVDFGQIGLCDRDSVDSAFDDLGDDRMNEFFDQLTTDDAFGFIHISTTRMFMFRPEGGDGVYPVYQLNSPDAVASGWEIDCEAAKLGDSE